MEYRVELRTVNQPDEVKIQDDPVRKGLSYDFRMSDGRQIYTIPNKAVVCTAKTENYPSLWTNYKDFQVQTQMSLQYFTQYGVTKKVMDD